jgi:hypothetical protein
VRQTLDTTHRRAPVPGRSRSAGRKTFCAGATSRQSPMSRSTPRTGTGSRETDGGGPADQSRQTKGGQRRTSQVGRVAGGDRTCRLPQIPDVTLVDRQRGACDQALFRRPPPSEVGRRRGARGVGPSVDPFPSVIASTWSYCSCNADAATRPHRLGRGVGRLVRGRTRRRHAAERLRPDQRRLPGATRLRRRLRGS